MQNCSSFAALAAALALQLLLVLPVPTTAAICCKHPAAGAELALISTEFSIVDA
jgi:hypothetical protein